MAFKHAKAAMESDIYAKQGAYRPIFIRICSLVRKEDTKHAGWCTASQSFLAEGTGYSLRQVERAMGHLKRADLFTIRTYRLGQRKYNHYKPNMPLILSRKRDKTVATLIQEHIPCPAPGIDNGSTRQNEVRPAAIQSPTGRQRGGVVSIESEVDGERVTLHVETCKELRSKHIACRPINIIKPITKAIEGCAPEPPADKLRLGSPTG